MADSINIFTYGSLMFPAVWHTVVRGDYRSSPATIHGFRRVCVRDAKHPTLTISARAAPIAGRVYFDVSTDDIARLDHFETDSYQRVSVAVTVEGSAGAGQAYLAVNTDSLTDINWNEKSFEQAGLPLFLATYAVKNRPHN